MRYRHYRQPSIRNEIDQSVRETAHGLGSHEWLAIPCWIIRPRSVLRLPHPARRTSLRRQRTRLALRGGSRKQGSCSTRGVSFGSLYGQFGEDLLSWNGLDSTAENFFNAGRDRTSPCIVHRLLIYDLNRVQQPQGHVLAHRRRPGQTRLVKLRCDYRHAHSVRPKSIHGPASLRCAPCGAPLPAMVEQ